MTKLIIIFFSLFISANIFAQTGFLSGSPHDSLLFDGENESMSISSCDTNCIIKITELKNGTIHGWRCVKKKGLMCGVKEVEGIVNEKIQLGVGDYIMPGDSIEIAGEDAQFSFSWFDKYVVYEEMFTVKFRNVSNTSAWVVPKGFCDQDYYEKRYIVKVNPNDWNTSTTELVNLYKIPLKVLGQFWIITKSIASGGKSFQVETERAVTGPRGTKFAIDEKENEETIKVYEGYVEVQPKKYDFDATMEISKLSEDYQNGKISLEEYTKRAKELSEEIKKESTKVSKPIIVEAGYQITIGNKIGDIIPIAVDDEKWWEK